MSKSQRRTFSVLAVALTCCLIPAAPSLAALRGARSESGITRVEEAPWRSFLWSLLTNLWQQAGVRIDNNGGS
jgi:hypothetical protein